MRKYFAIFFACFILLGRVMSVDAMEGQVIYSQGAEKFIFLPGSEASPTDLFPDFKDVMPGDTISQKILVKNDSSNDCRVRIYMRALGAHEDSAEFLSQLHLTVTKETDTTLFDAPADQTARLTDWVYLGTLQAGGECELTAALEVPVTLDNQFKQLVGYLDWEFAVEELPDEENPDEGNPDEENPDEGVPGEDKEAERPGTGDDSQPLLWAVLVGGSLIVVIILLIGGRKKKDEDS